jgi:hypothetical protein
MTGESDLPPDLATRADDLLNTRPNAGLLAGMTTDAFKASGLDHDTLVLVSLAALVALDAPTESYLINLGAAKPNRYQREASPPGPDGSRTDRRDRPRPLCDHQNHGCAQDRRLTRNGRAGLSERCLSGVGQTADRPASSRRPRPPGEPHTKCRGNVGTPVADPPPTRGDARKAEPEPSASTRQRSPHTARAHTLRAHRGYTNTMATALGLTARFAAGHRTDALGAPSRKFLVLRR